MTRFMMTLDESVELVLYAFTHGQNGDIFVQKAPAATVAVLAQALLEILGRPDHPVLEIGTRHGEKLYETLLSREEMSHAEDRGNYYRIPPDGRDLNYSKFVNEGERRISVGHDYNSESTRQLDVSAMKELLLRLEFVQRVAGGGPIMLDD
jgi:UDP-glucose 4-epimerase